MQDPSEDDQPNGIDRVQEGIKNSLDDIGTYFQVTGAQKIIRRYFAMNAFDGAMTSLGVVIGAYLSQIHEPRSVISVIITSGIAMMVSGFSGTYMTESAERSHSLNELEDAMLVNLDNTVYGKASRFISVFAAFVDGSAPFIASIPSLAPFLLVNGFIDIGTAFVASAAASLLTLFVLGVYLGKIGGDNILVSGLKMVVSGIAVALIALLLNVH
ncbi:VIT1/CCC1 transporter family protein [Candidatus Bathyarchaeota archaeon]|nr:VIT1/CCC1 transporter family protein [Candidatus Bathyarchaeota archaeon]